MLLHSINNSLNELKDLLVQLSNVEYSKPCISLSNSTIGEHTRHIIEMFQCLVLNYDSGIVNYDNRERNHQIQTDTSFAISQIEFIQNVLEKENKKLQLQQIVDAEELRIETNYFRELLYNLEHCIHHQALIKVGVIQNCSITLNENFGVARSTIEYRNQCVQ
ncbi:DinB family protein [Flavobacterium sp. NG2]|uniref:DinB family protein n=1 Tax=Flavobacterium sp. NG2 TaxID=3097547 RepID=UPI002A81A716|nr:DinB family protein [Flavobacterium sp. NG2]WPR72662.1 DinB family protein [Flavobacterium sp. NG2]